MLIWSTRNILCEKIIYSYLKNTPIYIFNIKELKFDKRFYKSEYVNNKERYEYKNNTDRGWTIFCSDILVIYPITNNITSAFLYELGDLIYLNEA